MKILFSLRHPGALRNFASTIRELDSRGHQVHLEFMMQDKLGDGRLLWELTDNHPGITCGELGVKMPWRLWLGLARGIRSCADYLRYETPAFTGAVALRQRAASRSPRLFALVFRLPGMKSRLGLAAVAKVIDWMEHAIPADPWTVDLVAAQQPDLVLVSPLVDIGSDQVEYIKAARKLGIRSALCVHSWDNLTNKGLIRVLPDRVFVWNQAQKREAVEMHGCMPDQVVVTGAAVYDQWFARTPSTTRDEFCAKIGLPSERPYFLYLCSSQFIAPDEADFVADWVAAVRTAPDPRVREAGILIRPHPENFQPWQRFKFDEFQDVVLWPREGADPIDAGRKNDYYDSMYHAIAAVGINTSAQIESGIVGKPVYSIRVSKYKGTQEGTLHFHYLLNQGAGGLLTLGNDLAEHAQQLTTAIDGTGEDRAKLLKFVEAFVRPHGLNVPATPIMADSLEALGHLPKPVPETTSLGQYLMRGLLYPVAMGMKVARQFLRLGPSRKRKWQLRPQTFVGVFSKSLFWMLDKLLRWTPMKKFARRYVMPRVLPPEMLTGEMSTEERVAIPRLIGKIATGDKPVIVGPWLNEVGVEVLCWIPFLNWVKRYRHFDPERLVIVSRGGVSGWYKDIGAKYIDLFDFYTPGQFRQKNEQRLEQTQKNPLVLSDFDREIFRHVQQALGTRGTDVLHPRYMYRLFYPSWKSQMSLSLVESFASFERLPALDTSELDDQLPKDFVAVGFHFNESFPDTDENRRFVSQLVETMSETTEVVLLNSNVYDDEPWDIQLPGNSRVHTVGHLMTPRNNLDIQTKVIARARRFVGTCGGLSYLPPFYGVPSLVFYSDPSAQSSQHLELARRVFSGMKRGSFVAMDVNDLDLVRLVLRDPQALAAPTSR